MIEKYITKNKKDQNSLYSKYSICVIFLTNLIFFLPYLFTSKPITIGTYVGDTIRRFRPIRHFAALQLQQGDFPFWNPFLLSGHPFIADPETAMFYLFTYLFAVLPLHLASSRYFFSLSDLRDWPVFIL